MTDNQKPALKLMLANHAAARVPAVELTQMNIDYFWAGLRDLPFGLVERGLALAVRRCPHFPTIADIRASLDIDPNLKAELMREEAAKVRDDSSLAAKIAFVAKQLRGPTEPYTLNQILEALSDLNPSDVRSVLDDLVRTNTFWPSIPELRNYVLMKAEAREWDRKQALIAAAEQWDAEAPEAAKAQGVQTGSERGLAVLRAMTQPGGMELFAKTTVCGCGTRVYADKDGGVYEFATKTRHLVCLPAAVEAKGPKPPFCGFCEDTGFAMLTCSPDSPCQSCRKKGTVSYGGHRYVRVCECRATNPVYQKHVQAAREQTERRAAKSKALTRREPKGQRGWSRVGEADAE